MLHPFVGTGSLSATRPSALLISVVAHVALVVVAFAPRGRVSRIKNDFAPTRPLAQEHVRYIQVDAPVAPSEPTPPPRAKREGEVSLRRLPKIEVPKIAAVAIAGPAVVADVDFRAKATDSIEFAQVHLADMVKSLVEPRASPTPRTGPYTQSNVDKAVVPFTNNPTPVYPPRLRETGVEGTFVAQFVVDSTGRVIDQTLLFPPAANRLFVDSVRRALGRSRYYPAEVDGERVAQLVEQRFTFVLVR